MSDLIGALKLCYLDSVCTSEMQHNSDSPATAINCMSGPNTEGAVKVKILASDFVRLVREIKPAVALKHDIASLLVDSIDSSNEGRAEHLVGIKPLQDRLRKSVLLPYELCSLPRHQSHDRESCRHRQTDIGSCSGKTLCDALCLQR